jgi:hypothetical protein
VRFAIESIYSWKKLNKISNGWNDGYNQQAATKTKYFKSNTALNKKILYSTFSDGCHIHHGKRLQLERIKSCLYASIS